MLGIAPAVLVAVLLAFALGVGVGMLYVTRKRAPRWPLVECDSSGKTAMDYLFEILATAQSAGSGDRERIEELARACMSHVAERYAPPAAYPQDGHAECLHKALSAAECSNWRLVIEELDHDG